MRFSVAVPTCLGLGAISLALADPPAPSPSPTTAAPAADVPAAAPAATAAPPAATAAPPAAAGTPPAAAQATSSAPATGPTVDQYEKHFLAEGYKLEMHHGQKLFCRTEEIVGSRLGGQRVCATLQQLRATETDTRESIERWQRTSPSPTGH